MTHRHPTHRRITPLRTLLLFLGTSILLTSIPLWSQPTPAASASFNRYTQSVELRLTLQHQSPETFLAGSTSRDTQTHLHAGDQIIERLSPTPSDTPSGSMLHHWRGTAFAPGATAADFERLMRDVNAYPHAFSPQVLQTSLISQNGDAMQMTMRVRQKHVLTVVLDGTYTIAFHHLDPSHGYSISRSQRIAEIDAAGTSAEHPLGPHDEHGFLWRLNTYWTYEERDGGLYLQIEALSLTRNIPAGLGWAVRPYVESIPRESLEFTLRSTCNALRK